MVTTTEFVTEKERRYGIGYRPISSVSTGRFVDDSIFMPEKEEVVIERRISVPEQKIERKVEVKEAYDRALKIKETSYKNISAAIFGEFMHGHVAVLNNKKSTAESK